MQLRQTALLHQSFLTDYNFAKQSTQEINLLQSLLVLLGSMQSQLAVEVAASSARAIAAAARVEFRGVGHFQIQLVSLVLA
jgi:hypothetical protein